MISKRLNELVKRVPKVDTVIDVGCDHGKVSHELLKRGIAQNAILTDISAPSLMKARNLIEEQYPNTKYYVTNGLDGIDEQFDFCVIAGMGGIEISKILSKAKVNKALLQPMNHIGELRKFLVNNGYIIVEDEIVEDEKFYNMIVIERGYDELNEDEVLFGRTNLVNISSDFIAYLKHEISKKREKMLSIPKDNSKYIEFEKYTQKAESILNENS